MDIVSPQVRSRMMSGIRSTNTRPEMIIRRALHRRGFRFRLHDKRLPGKPDIVLRKYKAVIFAHGCFWHGHQCPLFKWPTTRKMFWRTKITRNRRVDARARSTLHAQGWRVLIIWECSLKGGGRLPIEQLSERVARWLFSNRKAQEIRGSARSSKREE